MSKTECEFDVWGWSHLFVSRCRVWVGDDCKTFYHVHALKVSVGGSFPAAIVNRFFPPPDKSPNNR